MKITAHYILVIVYALTGMWIFLQLFEYLVIPLDSLIEVTIGAVWLCTCFTAYRWSPALVQSQKSIRMTLLEEDEWLHPIIHELNLRTMPDPVPELLIQEDPRVFSFVEGNKTIVISKGMLALLSPLEIKALLAYEYAHLKFRDRIPTTAMQMAAIILWRMYAILNTVFTFLIKHCWKKKNIRFRMFMGALFLLLCIKNFDLAFFLVILYIFKKIYPFYQIRVFWLWHFITRNLILKQYHFAESLGYGKDLKSAVLKVETLHTGSFEEFTRLFPRQPLLNPKTHSFEWLENREMLS